MSQLPEPPGKRKGHACYVNEAVWCTAAYCTVDCLSYQVNRVE